MKPTDKYEEDDSSGQGGSGIEFVDFMSGKPQRDDMQLLSPHDLQQVLATHESTNKKRVEVQREALAALEAKKNGQKTPANQQSLSGRQSQYKQHPALDCAQFAGIDKQANVSPTNMDKDAKVNDEKRNELQYQHQLRFNPQNTPSPSTPRPSIYNR